MTKLSKNAQVPQCDKTAVMLRYFKCRFFKGQILHSKILEAKDEEDINTVFAKKYPNHHLLEAIEV